MRTLRFVAAAAIPAILLAAGVVAAKDVTPTVQRCIQVREGTRGYSSNKVYKCEVDLRQLKIVNDYGMASPAPVGAYRIGAENRTLNVGPGGFILK